MLKRGHKRKKSSSATPSPVKEVKEREGARRKSISIGKKSKKAPKIFGTPLQDLVSAYGTAIPEIVRDTIRVMDKDLELEGLFILDGVPPYRDGVAHLRRLYDENVRLDESALSAFSSIEVGGVFKQWLQELPEPLLTNALYDDFMTAASIVDPYDRFQTLQSLIAQLPEVNKFLLGYILAFFNRVSLRSASNNFTPFNLGRLFGPILLPPKNITIEQNFKDTASITMVTSLLIQQYRFVLGRGEIVDMPGLQAGGGIASASSTLSASSSGNSSSAAAAGAFDSANQLAKSGSLNMSGGPPSGETNSGSGVSTSPTRGDPPAAGAAGVDKDDRRGRITRMRAKYNFNARNASEISFRKGNEIEVLSRDSGGWWEGEVHGQVGLFPANYCEPIAWERGRNLAIDVAKVSPAIKMLQEQCGFFNKKRSVSSDAIAAEGANAGAEAAGSAEQSADSAGVASGDQPTRRATIGTPADIDAAKQPKTGSQKLVHLNKERPQIRGRRPSSASLMRMRANTMDAMSPSTGTASETQGHAEADQSPGSSATAAAESAETKIPEHTEEAATTTATDGTSTELPTLTEAKPLPAEPQQSEDKSEISDVSDVVVLRQKIQELENEVSFYQVELEQAKERLDAESKRRAKAETERNAFKKELEKESRKRSKSKKERKQLRYELEEARAEMAGYLEQMTAVVREKEASQKEFERQLRAREEIIEAKNAALAQMETLLKKAAAERDSAEIEAQRRLSIRESDLQQLRSMMAEQESKLAASRVSEQERIVKVEAQLRDVTKALEEAKLEKARLVDEYAEELRRLTKAKDAELAEKESEISRRSKELNDRQRAVVELQLENDELRQAIEREQAAREELQHQLEEKEQELAAVRENAKAAVQPAAAAETALPTPTPTTAQAGSVIPPLSLQQAVAVTTSPKLERHRPTPLSTVGERIAGDKPRTPRMVAEEEERHLRERTDQELSAAVKSVEESVQRLFTSQTSFEFFPMAAKKASAAPPSVEEYRKAIFDSVRAVTSAMSILVKAATAAQKALGSSTPDRELFYHKNSVWAEGLISAAKAVAAASQRLVAVASGMSEGRGEEEAMTAVAKSVLAATARLVTASRIKAEPGDPLHMKLEEAAKAVNGATNHLLECTKQAAEHGALTKERPSTPKSPAAKDALFAAGAPSASAAGAESENHLTGSIIQEMEQQMKILKLEKELEKARQEFLQMRRKKYQK